MGICVGWVGWVGWGELSTEIDFLDQFPASFESLDLAKAFDMAKHNKIQQDALDAALKPQRAPIQPGRVMREGPEERVRQRQMRREEALLRSRGELGEGKEAVHDAESRYQQQPQQGRSAPARARVLFGEGDAGGAESANNDADQLASETAERERQRKILMRLFGADLFGSDPGAEQDQAPRVLGSAAVRHIRALEGSGPGPGVTALREGGERKRVSFSRVSSAPSWGSRLHGHQGNITPNTATQAGRRGGGAAEDTTTPCHTPEPVTEPFQRVVSDPGAQPKLDEAGWRLSIHNKAKEETHYQVLSAHPESSQAKIRKRYLMLVKQFHPDHAAPGMQAHAHEAFTRINEAYHQLSDPHRRDAYDAQLEQKREVAEAAVDTAEKIRRSETARESSRSRPERRAS